jgi:hypothetical protein
LNGNLGRFRIRLGEVVPPAPEKIPDLAPPIAKHHFRLFACLAASSVCASYLLMVNRYWHFTPDSAVYLTLARNLLAGKGYVFNGVRHTKCPGRMPFLLSLLLRASNEFVWLNLAQCLIMLAALAILFLALRLVADPTTSVLIVLLTASLFWVHEYACTLMSEAPFLLLSSLAVLLLLLLVRSRCGRCKALLLVAVCAIWVAAFWFRVVACFWIGPFAATLLLGGRPAHPLKKRVLNASIFVLVVLLTVTIYYCWGATESTPLPLLGPYAHPMTVRAMVARTTSLPRWPMLVLCPPWEAVGRARLPGPAAATAQWLCLAVVLLGSWRALGRGQVLVASSILFFIPFALSGPGQKATSGRYAISVAPFVILLFLLGLGAVGEFMHKRIHRRLSRRLLLSAGTMAVLVPNVLLLVGDIWVQRRADFYAAYRAGAYAELMGILKWLRKEGVREPVAAQSMRAYAAIPCLSGLRAIWIPKTVTVDSPEHSSRLTEYARRERVRYLITPDRTQPWPVWHLPRHYVDGPRRTGPHWQLWEYRSNEGRLRRLEVEPSHEWPTRLPMDGT